MASNFPNAVDSFVNPQYQKVNAIDYVKAEHINDLQDAVRNVQLGLIGSGLSINFSSNNYVPVTADFKTAVEILDAEVYQRELDFQNHLDSVMPTDPFQHHANVIEVTPIGNLGATRLQWALEELQQNIDMIMTGGQVESLNLDDRYLKTFGSNICDGNFVVNGAFSTKENVILGASTTHSVETSGDLTVGQNLTVVGASQFLGDVKLPDVSKLGASSNLAYSHIAFGSDKVIMSSIKDIEMILDANDPIDGISENAEFRIKNASNNILMSLLENGELSVLTSIRTMILKADSHIEVGSGTPARIENDLLGTQAPHFVLQVDSSNAATGGYFAVTKDGDTGSLDTSTRILLKASAEKIIAGNHVLTRGVPETGYFGIKFYSENAGGRFHGQGVNFKSKTMTTPSSVVLNVNAVKSHNYNNLSITDINEYGFFFECDSTAVGDVEVKGTYETVGN
ncbi:MAG: hypothetical protein PHY47_00420 [Lachnospiraceae bacterium]|nr:hypothetical protein [Lachnospiraceae bacterium]